MGWLLVAQIGTAFWATALIAVRHGTDAPSPLPIGTIFLGAFGLWFAYGFGTWWSATRRGNGPQLDLGATLQGNDIPLGLLAGVLLQLAVIPAVYWPILQLTDADLGESARRLIDTADTLAELVMLFLLVVVAAPLVEEFFYRGLVLRALVERIGRWPAVLVSSALFAAVHLQFLEFIGLFIFGVAAALLAIWTGRLGPSWALHVGFNATTLIVLLLT